MKLFSDAAARACALGLTVWCAAMLPTAALAEKAELRTQGGRVELRVDGEPFRVKGAGGDAGLARLAEAGGNTVRTWGVGDETQAVLDDAERLGLKVVLGLWLGHDRHGFDYDDPAQVRAQHEEFRAAVLKYKDHPALLMWGVGNETEIGLEGAKLEKMWRALNDIALMVKELDPDHPTMTVTSEVNEDTVSAVRDFCTAIDVHGINSYGGAPSVPKRYRALGGTKPYMVTEFGPLGVWDLKPNDFGAYVEPGDAAKAERYAETYRALEADADLCLGSFAFLWGDKQEVTSTWFGMFLADGAKLAAVDTMTELWTGAPASNRVPAIERFALQDDVLEPGALLAAELGVRDPEGDPLRVRWELVAEGTEFKTGGDEEDRPDSFPDAVLASGERGAVVKLPDAEGVYRLFVWAYDDHGGGATANRPVHVTTQKPAGAVAAVGANEAFPLSVYPPGAAPAYFPSGYFGDADAVRMDEQWKTDPHSGASCIEARFTQATGWGGVVWQHPANDWGDQLGGHNLSGAATLSFWARGAKGGETVKFGFGLLGSEATYRDSGKGEIEVKLTTEWTRYEVDVAGKDLGRIKTGFYWVLAAEGEPVTFYLDDIGYAAAGAE